MLLLRDHNYYFIQVKVRDIHVRYEDGVTNPDTLLAAGITLHSLELKVPMHIMYMRAYQSY